MTPEEEELQRLQFAAISTVSLCNTPASLAQHRIDSNNPYWTPAYEDVVIAMLREMALLERVAELEEEKRPRADRFDIDIGDEVLVRCHPDVRISGRVRGIPQATGDSWVIVSDAKEVYYVQTFLFMQRTKRAAR